MNHRDTETQRETQRDPIPDAVNETSGFVVDAAFQVHKTLGPGLLESVYEECLLYELANRGLDVRRQVQVPLIYKELQFDCGFRIDLLVSDEVVVEIKAVDAVLPIHLAQILTYLKITEKRVGLLINFNKTKIKNGIHRFVL
ncbi:MAG: GxxExxY protein [Acidobacteria bacterium]|nr:GxxExxY protein [Candidatus Sulfomarinibacter kjeldsenii]MBD3856031.1 GxxExxY protein [Candidatus Sulfomarinibacter kjeldsenii]